MIAKSYIFHIIKSWCEGKTLEYRWKNVPPYDERYNVWYDLLSNVNKKNVSVEPVFDFLRIEWRVKGEMQ